ncbi:MAG TPA: MFS transporter [Actinomycetes bacterium]
MPPSTPPSPASLRSLQRRTMRVLVVAQFLGAFALAAGGTAGALLAEHLTGGDAAAGLPLGVLVLGAGISAVAVTRLMDRRGRRAGLAAAHLTGALGAAVAVVAAALRSWPLLLAGCLLLGAGQAAVMLARYAAADLASRRGRAISTAVVAASVGAVLGPNLLGPAGHLALALGLPEPAGLFLLAMPEFLAAALVTLAFLRPDPLRVARAAAPASGAGLPSPTGAASGLRGVLGDRHARLAVLVLATSNLAMVAVMAVTPVHLHAHGAGTTLVGLMVSVHIGAMFLPSPLTGWLADARGGRQVAAAGALLLLGAGVVGAMAGSGRAEVMAALLLLGAGWNAGLVGGSALLREAPVDPSLRTRAEGIGELGMGAAAAVGGSGAGPLLAMGGFALLGLVAAVPCLLLFAVLAAGERRAGGLARTRRAGFAATGAPSALERGGSE